MFIVGANYLTFLIKYGKIKIYQQKGDKKTMAFELPELNYNFNALEPVMDAKTVEIHYTKHHQAYVNNLNAALSKYPEINYDLVTLLKNLNNLPADIQTAVRNNGGGHFNHTHFWNVLSPMVYQTPSGELLKHMELTFGSFENFKAQFEDAGKKHFGSGWVWLIRTHVGELKIVTLPNQDAPVTFGTPLLGIDLWEHAYYLQYQNRRPDYLATIWTIINWSYVEDLYNA